MIVVDASVILHILGDSAVDATVLEKISSNGELIAPHLLDLEFLSAIRRQVRLKEITEKRAQQALIDFAELTIKRKAVHHLAAAIWKLRDNITPYDAAYVVLAADLHLPLLTRDKKLAQAAAAFTKIELI